MSCIGANFVLHACLPQMHWTSSPSRPPLNFFFILLLKYFYTPLIYAITSITHHLIWPESSSPHRDPWKKMLNCYVAFIVIIVGESGWFVYEPATALFSGNFLTLHCHHCCRVFGPERTLWKYSRLRVSTKQDDLDTCVHVHIYLHKVLSDFFLNNNSTRYYTLKGWIN